jgi:hypothetical protein
MRPRGHAGPVGEREPRADGVPGAGLDRHEGAARAQKPGSLVEHRLKRPLVGDVMEDEPIEDDIEGARRVWQLAGPPHASCVELAVRQQHRDHRPVEVHPCHPESRLREEVAARMPAAADGQHVAALERQAVAEDLALTAHLLVVVDLERVRAGEAV